MALPLPDLDDRTFTDLLEEARARIISHDPDWTNHNPSDPGVTLIELFAWLAEMLIYRANRVPDHHLITFLRLLNGPAWKPGADLDEDIRTTAVALRQRDRAVTCQDHEELARAASTRIARARCVPRRYLGGGTEAERTAPRPGHVSVIIVPDEGLQPDDTLLQSVRDHLEPRRLVSTRTHVVGPIYAPVGAEILLARRPDMPSADLRTLVVGALEGFLDPRTGGTEGAGWPFGRNVYVSELYELLEGIAGVDYVPDLVVSSRCPPDARRCVAAEELWNEDGELVGLGLAGHHLPQAAIDPARVVISASFVAVEVTIRARWAPEVPQEEARRTVRAALKRLLHPLHGGPDGTAAKVVTVSAVDAAVRAALGVGEEDVAVELRCDAAHLLRDDDGVVVGVRVQAGELADAHVTVVPKS
jgi:hypothetical protein